MSPFLAVRLEALVQEPGMLSSGVISATAYDAVKEIRRLEAAI